MIYSKIKEILGFDPNESDNEFLIKWRQMVKNAKKPCWDLNFCPYGKIVEQFPLLPPSREVSICHNDYLKECLENETYGNNQPLDDNRRKLFEKMIAEFKPEDYPEDIPIEIVEWQCSIFGHICPVIFTAEKVAEEHP